MDDFRIIEIKKSVYGNNNAEARSLRRKPQVDGMFLIKEIVAC